MDTSPHQFSTRHTLSSIKSKAKVFCPRNQKGKYHTPRYSRPPHDRKNARYHRNSTRLDRRSQLPRHKAARGHHERGGGRGPRLLRGGENRLYRQCAGIVSSKISAFDKRSVIQPPATASPIRNLRAAALGAFSASSRKQQSTREACERFAALNPLLVFSSLLIYAFILQVGNPFGTYNHFN